MAKGLDRSPSEHKLAYSPEEAAAALGLGLTSIYALLKDGRLKRLKFGRRTLIPRDAMIHFLKELEEQSPADRSDARAQTAG